MAGRPAARRHAWRAPATLAGNLPHRLGYPSRPFPSASIRALPALLCFCACPDEATATGIARALVDERLAACVNILPAMRSVYRWQGRVETAGESLLLAKTTDVRLPALRERILALHPYELPEVIAVEVAAGLPAYLDWVAAETGGAGAADPAS